MSEQDQQAEVGRIRIPLDPWSNTPTTDDDWVVLDYPEGDDIWEVTAPNE